MRALIAIIASILCLSQNVAAETAAFNIKAAVDVHNLVCIIRPIHGNPEDHKFTVLGDDHRSIFLRTGSDSEIKFEHKAASAAGCDMDALLRIEDKAVNSFGFLYDVPVKGERTMRTYRDTLGECHMTTTERLEIDLGEGVIVYSSMSGDQKSTECR